MAATCIRVFSSSVERLNPRIDVLTISEEFFHYENEAKILVTSPESFGVEGVSFVYSEEGVSSQAEHSVQFPDSEGDIDIVDPAEDPYEDEYPPPFTDEPGSGEEPGSGDPLEPSPSFPDNVPPGAPLPGGWPLRFSDSTVNPSFNLLEAPTISLNFPGINVDRVTAFSISETRGSSCTGSVSFRDKEGGTHKSDTVGVYGFRSNPVQPHNMTPSRSIRLSVSQKGVNSRYPNFIPEDPNWDEDGTISLAVSDYGRLLNLDNQTLPNIIAEEGDKSTANQEIVKLGRLAGVTINPKVRNFGLRNWRFNNQNVAQGLSQLMQVTQGFTVFQGSTCEIKSLANIPAPKWRLRDRLHLESVTGRIDTSNLRNFFRAFRAESQTVPLGDPISCVGGQCVGRVVNFSFAQPTNFAIMLWHSRNTSIVDGVFFDENDVPLNMTPSNVFNGGNRKAVRWEATCKPAFRRYAQGKYIPEWRVYALGGGAPPSDLDTSEFTYEQEVSNLVSRYGLRPETADLQSDLIKDNATLTFMLQAILKEVEWSLLKVNVSTPFLIPVRIGETIALTDKILGISGEVFLVNSWTHSWSEETGFNTDLELWGKLW